MISQEGIKRSGRTTTSARVMMTNTTVVSWTRRVSKKIPKSKQTGIFYFCWCVISAEQPFLPSAHPSLHEMTQSENEKIWLISKHRLLLTETDSFFDGAVSDSCGSGSSSSRFSVCLHFFHPWLLFLHACLLLQGDSIWTSDIFHSALLPWEQLQNKVWISWPVCVTDYKEDVSRFVVEQRKAGETVMRMTRN